MGVQAEQNNESSDCFDESESTKISMPEGRVKGFNGKKIYNATYPHTASATLLEWFEFGHSKRDSSVKIPLPPSLSSEGNWIGLALCAHFSYLEINEATSIDKVNPQIAELHCYLETENSCLQHLHHYRPNKQDFKWSSCPTKFIWLSYIPRDQGFFDQSNERDLLDASFASESPGMYAEVCGLRLVYQHDEQELKDLCMFMMNSFDEDEEKSERLDELEARKMGNQVLNCSKTEGQVPGKCSDESFGLQLPKSFSGLSSIMEALLLNLCDLSEGEIPDDIGSLLLHCNILRVYMAESISEHSMLRLFHIPNCRRNGHHPAGLQLLHSILYEVIALSSFQSLCYLDLTHQFVQAEKNQPSHYFDRGESSNVLMHEGRVKGFNGKFIYNATYPHSASATLLEWFGHSKRDTSVKIPLPPSLSSDGNCIGLALCAQFSYLENEATSIDKVNPEIVELDCYLETENNCLKHLHHYGPNKEDFKGACPTKFIWLSYIPRDQGFLDQLNDCDLLNASFASESPGMYAEVCGLRLVYQHDEQELMDLCIFMNSLLEKKPEKLHEHEACMKGKQVLECLKPETE